jgi:uncharacterized membrane protein
MIGRLSSWDPVNTLTVVLAALSALLTALGIGVGLLAFWGYTAIREHAATKAEAAAAIKSEEIATAVADKAARETAALVAARTVQAMLKQESGPSGDYGKAAGDDSGQTTG